MALSRLLFSGTKLHLAKQGFSRSRGRSFSASKALTKKKSTQEKRTEDVKSFIEREEHQGHFPKITEVRKAVGGSYNILKGIFSKFQETFLEHSAGPTPQGQEEALTKPCPKERLNESVNESSSLSEQTKHCAEVFNENTSISSTVNIKELTTTSLDPLVDEKPPDLHIDSLKINGVIDIENIGSELSTKKRDFKERVKFRGSKTRCTDNADTPRSKEFRGNSNTSYFHNIIKGLQNGPKSIVQTTSVGSKESIVGLGTGSSECLGSAEEELLQRRDLNGTKGGSALGKDNKMFVLFDVFKRIQNKPENGVDGMAKTNDVIKHKTMSREEHGARNGDGYDQIGSIFSQIITKKEKHASLNTGSEGRTLANKKSSGSSYAKALNILSNKTKYVGGITDVLRKVDTNKEVTENKNSDSDIAACEYLGFQPAVVAPTFTPKERSQYGLFVSFLDKAVSVTDVHHAFDGCGPLHGVQLTSSGKHDRYKSTNVFFKAEQGLKNALNITDPVICGNDVVVRPMGSYLSKRLNIHANMVVQDHNFPAHLLKYPSRSVAIEGLMDNLPFDHLRHALELFGPISAVAIGQSNSSVYVEFESEESIERALEAASVTVIGKKLKIHRVNAPNNSVVRVSKVSSETGEGKIVEISNKFSEGKVKRVVQRGSGIFDVHFKFSELPNMLEILNSLNGLVFDQSQWIAQPATFIPVEIIQSLCDDPQGCKQVQGIFHNLCMKVETNSSINSDLWSTGDTEAEWNSKSDNGQR